MDIRTKLLEKVDANDPQFKVLLNNTLQAEIASLEEELNAKKARNERKRQELANVLECRKNLKKSIQEKSKLVNSIQRATYCLQDYSKDMLEKLEVTQNMLDESSLQKLSMIEETEKLRNKYEKKWKEYQMSFEKAPLAEKRRAAREELQKVEIQVEIAKMTVKAMERNYRDYQKIQGMKLQKDIIEIAQLWINHRDNVENLNKLKQEDAELKLKIAEQEKQIQAFIKEKEDEVRQKALARFQMPPPIMDQKLVQSIFSQSQYSQSTPKPVGKRHGSQNYSGLVDDLDSASISSSLFEEMCNINEKLNSADTQEIEQIENESDAVSLASNQDREFTRENSPEISGARSQIRQIKKPETAKRPANSLQESKIRKKLKDDISTPNINPKENKSQEKSNLSSDTIKTIQENVQKQGGRSDLPTRIVPERREIDQVNLLISDRREIGQVNSTIENLKLADNLILSPNHSFTESLDSIVFSGSNINEKDTVMELNSDLSLQSNMDGQNHSIDFSADELSNARSDANNFSDGNAVNPDPSALAPTGMFASQNKRFLNFQGLFF